MNIFQRIGVAFMSLFKTDTENVFHVKGISNEEMKTQQNIWCDIVRGYPEWIDENTTTINFAKFLSQYVAKKTCLDLNVSIAGSERADFINSIIKNMVSKAIREKVEDCCSYGGIILKPNGNANVNNAIDYITPWNFLITEKTSNGDIRGCIFIDHITKGTTYYTRLEYHHFILKDNAEYYVIEQKAFMSFTTNSLGSEVGLADVAEWRLLNSYTEFSNIEKPLFAYLKMPYNNTIDFDSPEGVAVFHNCIEELKGLDIAYSRMMNEVDISEHLTFMNETALSVQSKEGRKRRMVLPRFIKGVGSTGMDKAELIDEHVATMLTTQRLNGINMILSLIATKCGFSSGQFSLNEKSGRLTATEVESDDSETVETIAEIRNSLKIAIKELVYALDKYCDVVYGLPKGEVNALEDNTPDEDIFYFKDLMASFEQDRNRAYQLVLCGVYSKKKYLQEYEGFSEREAKEILEEVKEENKTSDSGLFEDETGSQFSQKSENDKDKKNDDEVEKEV